MKKIVLINKSRQQVVREEWEKTLGFLPEYEGTHYHSFESFEKGSFDPKLFSKIPTISGTRLKPLSLEGIENNNGWIFIFGTEDYPKEHGELYWVIDNEGHKYVIDTSFVESIDLDVDWESIVCYRKIKEPKDPLFNGKEK